MKYVKGDLIQLALNGEFDLIVHGCNCFCKWGAGIAKQMKESFPFAHSADYITNKGDKSKLGTYISTKEHGIIVINAYTQYNYGRGLQADYDAIRSIMKQLKLSFHGRRIGMPLIGAGHAGGDWEVISKIIEEELSGEDVTIVLWNKK